MKLKIFCRCSLFPSYQSKCLITHHRYHMDWLAVKQQDSLILVIQYLQILNLHIGVQFFGGGGRICFINGDRF